MPAHPKQRRTYAARAILGSGKVGVVRGFAIAAALTLQSAGMAKTAPKPISRQQERMADPAATANAFARGIRGTVRNAAAYVAPEATR